MKEVKSEVRPLGDAARGSTGTVTCVWCQQPESIGSVLYEEESFVLLEPGAASCAPDSLTLVPRAHVAVLTELSPDDMAGVLAGLSRLARDVPPMEQFTVVTHTELDGGHVHFHPSTSRLVGTGSD
jgi:diadenosine tetraphosphate (Ap4A) HIT family hydrolase